MAGIMHISEAFNLAMHAMLALAMQPTMPQRTPDLAQTFGASQAHLAKVFQRLDQAGLVKSRRGPQGGFLLINEPPSVSLLQIYEAIEGPWRKVNCLLKRPICNKTKCALAPLLTRVNDDAYNYLSKTTLADLTPFFDSGRLFERLFPISARRRNQPDQTNLAQATEKTSLKKHKTALIG